jgi:hypothetical protein
MRIAATIFGILVGIFLIVSGTLLPLPTTVSILLVCMGAATIAACVAYIDFVTSYK